MVGCSTLHWSISVMSWAVPFENPRMAVNLRVSPWATVADAGAMVMPVMATVVTVKLVDPTTPW